MSETEKHPTWTSMLDAAHTFYYGEDGEKKSDERDLDEVAETLSRKHLHAFVLAHLNRQVENGGFCQWVGNGYAVEEWPYVEEALLAMNTESSEEVLKMISTFIGNVKVGEVKRQGCFGSYWETDTESYEEEEECFECGGEGEDEEGNPCHACRGSGYVMEEHEEETELGRDEAEAQDTRYYDMNDGFLDDVEAYLKDEANDGTPGPRRSSRHETKPPVAQATGVRYPDVHVKLTGTDGNAFAVMGAVRLALKKAKVSNEEISRFTEEATSSDYSELLCTCMRWVNVA